MAHLYGDRYGERWQWVDASDGHVPDNAVHGGEDVNGEPLFVARVIHDGDTIPGKLVPSHNVCYVSYAGGEHAHRHYQVLVSGDEMRWKPSKDGKVKKRAIQGGCTVDEEPLFIGRAYHGDSLVIGKVHPSHGKLYFPFGGEEHNTDQYEILRHKKHY